MKIRKKSEIKEAYEQAIKKLHEYCETVYKDKNDGMKFMLDLTIGEITAYGFALGMNFCEALEAGQKIQREYFE